MKHLLQVCHLHMDVHREMDESGVIGCIIGYYIGKTDRQNGHCITTSSRWVAKVDPGSFRRATDTWTNLWYRQRSQGMTVLNAKNGRRKPWRMDLDAW